MTTTEQELLAALGDLEAGVAAMKTAQPRPNLLPLFSRIDTLTAQLPAEASPELLHFLRKRSYEKARLWLEDRRDQILRGGCRSD
ncbi:MAG TPA: hypothetical protein VEH04_17295 [Verrucomicrobiae bacterium]|nr:hypothetical protein [Verrucomicrobiae bacterium]